MKGNKKKKVLRIFGVIILLLVIIVGIFINKIFNRVTNSLVISNSNRNEKWTSDIQFLKDELPKKHNIIKIALWEVDNKIKRGILDNK